MNIWSLFSGIGGLELGLERAGLGETVFQCEIDPFAQKILAKHWPGVMQCNDVKKIKISNGAYVKSPDLICGGFPCQPHSLAGKRKGADDERHLWPEFARIIGEFKPTFVVAENVPGIRTNGALNEVLSDLTFLGYDAEWVRLGAAAVGAPHLRERIFVVAYPSVDRSAIRDYAKATVVHPDTNSVGFKNVKESDIGPKTWFGAQLRNHTYGLCADLAATTPFIFTDAQRAKLPIHPNQTSWACEPDVGRVAYGIPNRVDRLKALGNAVVPQVSEFVGTCIKEAICV